MGDAAAILRSAVTKCRRRLDEGGAPRVGLLRRQGDGYWTRSLRGIGRFKYQAPPQWVVDAIQPSARSDFYVCNAQIVGRGWIVGGPSWPMPAPDTWLITEQDGLYLWGEHLVPILRGGWTLSVPGCALHVRGEITVDRVVEFDTPSGQFSDLPPLRGTVPTEAYVQEYAMWTGLWWKNGVLTWRREGYGYDLPAYLEQTTEDAISSPDRFLRRF